MYQIFINMSAHITRKSCPNFDSIHNLFISNQKNVFLQRSSLLVSYSIFFLLEKRFRVGTEITTLNMTKAALVHPDCLPFSTAFIFFFVCVCVLQQDLAAQGPPDSKRYRQRDFVDPI